jgi:acetolactate synthase-1/2/3 large subunit
MIAQAERQGQEAGKRKPMHPRWVAYQLGKILEPDTILLDDAISNSGFVCDHHGRSQAGTYFASGGSSGGWGSGAAFGAKLAAPDRDVVLATGDGYFMFGTPMPALWSAAHYKAPFLALVFVNRSYTTGTNGLKRAYPNGVAVRTENYEGGIFDPPPDFAKLAEAANCFGTTVSEPEQVGPALKLALDQVRKGTPALVAAYLPTLVEEMSIAQRSK